MLNHTGELYIIISQKIGRDARLLEKVEEYLLK